MFIDETDQHTTDQAIVQIAKYIAENLNTKLNGSGKVLVSDDMNELIWNRNAVVSDLIGSESAIIRLENEVGSIDDEDDFKENIDYIHTYFRKGEIPPEFKERLHAPDDEIAVPQSSSSINNDLEEKEVPIDG